MIYNSWNIEQNILKLVILSHFLPFNPSPLKPPKIKISKNEKICWRYHHFTCVSKITMYGSWDTECNREKFLSFRTIFCRFTPLTTRKIKILKKWKNYLEIYIILHMCTINDSHMMYGSWDMECNRQNFLSFWTIFCPFTTLTTQQIKIFKKWKKYQEILSFYTVAT